MLEQLIVKDFALSDENTLDFSNGMSAITGETGAGKSLTVDALSLLLGSRADANMVRQGQSKAELNAVFNIENNKKAKAFLDEYDLASDDDSIILRRVINKDGKSKAFINNTPCTLAQLKILAESLVAIHGQHASIKLLDPLNQLTLLDNFAKLSNDVQNVNTAFAKYNTKRKLLQDLSQEQIEGAQSYKTLRYELDALNKLNLSQGEYEKISKDYDALQHQSQANDAVALAQGVLENEEHNVIDIISARINDLQKVEIYAKESISPIIQALSNACQSLDEAREQLDDLQLQANPELVNELSEKLSKCHELARRFNIAPQELYKVKDKLEKDLEHFLSLKEQIASLTNEVKSLRSDYEKYSDILSEKRQKAAILMGQNVTSKIKDLAMPDGIFKVDVRKDTECRPRANGRDEVLFLFTANIGEEPKNLGAVASGGELSRLALAIEVLTASANSTETLIFDEVDTGISGRTASSVGQLLRQLGNCVQVITVTHLPQVAACAHEQFLVSKEQNDTNALSHVIKLDKEGRVEELSRMMGGNVITEATLKSAQELLTQSGN